MLQPPQQQQQQAAWRGAQQPCPAASPATRRAKRVPRRRPQALHRPFCARKPAHPAPTAAPLCPLLLQDQYDGLILDPVGLPPTVGEFTSALDASLPEWRRAGKRGIWLKLPTRHAHYVGHAVDRGFQFHHAEQARRGGRLAAPLGAARQEGGLAAARAPGLLPSSLLALFPCLTSILALHRTT